MHLPLAPALLAALWAATAPAQPPHGSGELERARLTVAIGAAQRDSRQSDGVLPLRFDGLAPTQARLGLTYFPGVGPLGVSLDGSAEWFATRGANLDGTPVSLAQQGFFGSAAVAGRWAARRGVSLEAQLGWNRGQVPALDASTGALHAAALTHHGPLVAALARYDDGRAFSVALRAQASPFAAGASFLGQSLQVSQWGGALELALGGLEWGPTRVAAVVDFQVGLTTGARPEFSFSQWSQRAGLGLRLVLPQPVAPIASRPAAPPAGRIAGQVVLAESQEPVGDVAITASTGASTRSRADGRFELEGLAPGRVRLEAAVAGYRSATAEVEVTAGAATPALLAVARPSGPGRVRGTVIFAEGKAPAAGVTVQVGGAAGVETGADGAFTVEGVGPGPVKVVVRLASHLPLEEIVSVPPEAEARVELSLQRLTAKRLATIRGLVRSTSGAPVRATVRIPQANARVVAEADGHFSLKLPGGRYSVIIEAPGFRRQSKQLEVADGEEAIFLSELERATR